MVTCRDVAVCGARGTVAVFPACFGVMVRGPAVCAVDSLLTAFESYVTLFSTSDACRTVSIV